MVGLVHDAGTDAIDPGTPVERARRGEGRAAELLGIEPQGNVLRGILAHRQRTRHCFGGKLIAEAGLVRGCAGRLVMVCRRLVSHGLVHSSHLPSSRLQIAAPRLLQFDRLK